MLDAYYKGDLKITDYWSVGDTRTETIYSISDSNGVTQTAQTIELVIIDTNHDSLSTPIGSNDKAAITVQTKNCLNTKGYVEPGSDTYWSGKYDTLPIRDWCNTGFKGALLSDLSNLIKTVKKNTQVDSGKSYYRESVETNDDVFLVSAYEVDPNRTDYAYTSEFNDGYQYKYFQTTSNRVKTVNGTACEWWLRTCRNNNGNPMYYCCTSTGDMTVEYSSANTNYHQGIAPAFCL